MVSKVHGGMQQTDGPGLEAQPGHKPQNNARADGEIGRTSTGSGVAGWSGTMDIGWDVLLHLLRAVVAESGGSHGGFGGFEEIL